MVEPNDVRTPTDLRREFRRRAEEARKLAAKTSRLEFEEAYSDIARHWEKLADEWLILSNWKDALVSHSVCSANDPTLESR